MRPRQQLSVNCAYRQNSHIRAASLAPTKPMREESANSSNGRAQKMLFSVSDIVKLAFISFRWCCCCVHRIYPFRTIHTAMPHKLSDCGTRKKELNAYKQIHCPCTIRLCRFYWCVAHSVVHDLPFHSLAIEAHARAKRTLTHLLIHMPAAVYLHSQHEFAFRNCSVLRVLWLANVNQHSSSRYRLNVKREQKKRFCVCLCLPST